MEKEHNTNPIYFNKQDFKLYYPSLVKSRGIKKKKKKKISKF